MGNKYDDFEIDIPDFDNFGDDGEAKFNPSTRASGKRKAITEFGGSFLSGIKKSLLTPQNQRNFLNKVLPNSGYVKLYDSVSVAKSNIRDIYETSAEEVRKQANEMKGPLKTLNRVYGDNKLVPKKVKKMISEMETGGSNSYTSNPTDKLRQEMSDELGAIFEQSKNLQAAVAYQNKKVTEEATNKQLAASYTQTKISAGSFQHLGNISTGIQRLNAYQDTITAKVQRKTIELMYRQYAVQREQLDTLQQMREMQRESYRAIILNTGLPEAVKIQNMELAGQMLKKQMWGMVTQRVANNFKDVGSRITNHIGKSLVSSIQNFGSLANAGLDGLAMNAENNELLDELTGPKSRASKMGGYAAPFASWLIQRYGAKWVKKHIEGNQRIKHGSDRLLNVGANLPGQINRLMTEGTGNPIIDTILNTMGISQFAWQDNKRVRGSAVQDLDKQAFWNVQSQLALTEVIPGHLERMGVTLEKILTGRKDVAITRYDYETGKFVSTDELTQRFKGRFESKDKLEGLREQAERIVNNLDRNKELSSKARRELLKYVVKTAQGVEQLDIRALISDDSPLPNDVADEVAMVLGNNSNFNTDYASQHDRLNPMKNARGLWNSGAQFQERSVGVNESLNRLREMLPDHMLQAINASKTGNSDILERLGVVERTASGELQLNRKREMDLILGDQSNFTGTDSNARSTTAPPNRMKRRMHSRNARNASLLDQSTAEQSTATASTTISVGFDTMQSIKDEVIAAIERNSSIASIGLTNELLESIRGRLEMGVPMGGSPTDSNDQRQKSSFFRRALNGLQGLGSKAKSYAKWSYGSVIPGAFKLAFKPVSMVKNLLTRAGGARGIYDITSKKVRNKIMDVYIRGKDSPALSAAKMRAGEYFDQATGKVISNLKDIQGAVVDRLGNVVLDVNDIKSGLYTIKNGKMVSIIGSILGGGVSLLTRGVGGYVRAVGTVYGTAFNVAKWAVKKTLGIGFGRKEITQDVFVPGESSPRLRANLLRNGFYKNTDGTPIYRIRDVKGDILDSAGNLVLSAQEIAQGLVDKTGEELKDFTTKGRTLVGRLTSFAVGAAGSVLGAGFNLTKNIYKGYWKGLKGIAKGGKWGFGKLFGKKKASSAVGGDIHSFTAELIARQTDRLDDIYQLLDTRIPKIKRNFGDSDGDGLRDGSRESWFAKLQRVRKDDKVPTDDKDKDDKSKGLLGLLMAAVSGIGGLLGTVKAWGANMFGLMRATALMRAGGSLMGGLGALLGRGRGRMAGGRGAFSKLGGMVGGKAGLLKGLAFGAATAGIMAGFSGLVNAAEVGASGKLLSNAESSAMNAVNQIAGGGGGGSGSSNSGTADAGGNPSGDPKESLWWENLKTATMGSIGGEALAIAAAMGGTKLYDMYRSRKHGAMPTPRTPAQTPHIGKTGNFLLQNKYGRLLTAGATGMGLYAGGSALFGDDTEKKDLVEETVKSAGLTLGLEAAGAFALPWAIGKGMDWYRNRQAMKRGPIYTPITNPTVGRSPLMSNPMGAGRPTLVGPTLPPNISTARPGMMSRVGGSLSRHVGPLGLGVAALDAATTDGNAVDKTKAFGKSAAAWYATSKGLELAGRGLSGAKTLATNPAARLAAGTALRGAAAYALPLLTNPVVLGALAVAGIGYLAYKGYQRWFKKDKAALTRFRMAQYGYSLDKDEAKCKTIMALEEFAVKHVRIGKDRASFTKSMDSKTVLGLFGITPSDKQRVDGFVQWFNGRFKPVYMKSIWAAKSIGRKETLAGIDEFTREQKLNYLQTVNGQNATPFPYDVMVSPFTDQNSVRFDKADVESAYEKAVRDVKKEKTKERIQNEAKIKADVEKAKIRAETEKEIRRGSMEYQLDEMKVLRDDKQRQLQNRANESGSWIDRAKSFGYEQYNKLASTGIGRAVTAGAVRMGMIGGTPTIPFKGTADQKKWQLMVYRAFVNAGFSDAQARILTAEVGREGSYNPNNLFAGHADPHSGQNLGMISWQGSRKRALIPYLKQAGVLTANQTIVPGQKGLDAQAKFVMHELQTSHRNKNTQEFMNNRNIDYRRGAYLIGKYYILWRIDDPRYSAAGIKNRDGFYAMLNQQLGNKQQPTTPNKNTTNPAAGNTKFPGMVAAGRGTGAPPLLTNGKLNVPNVGNTQAGKMLSGSGIPTAPAPTGSFATNQSAVNFLKSLNKDDIRFGAKCITLAAGVDIRGMNQTFMAMFYAMATDYFRRTNKKIQVNSAYRTIQKQKELYDAWIARGKTGGAVAKPGKSRHNSGVAIDIQPVHANELDQLGLLKKYNFHRPVKGEAWHLENYYFSSGKATVIALEAAKSSPAPAAVAGQNAAGMNSGAPAPTGIMRPTGQAGPNAIMRPTLNAYGQPIGTQSTARASTPETVTNQNTPTPSNPTVSQTTQRKTETIVQATQQRQEEVQRARDAELYNVAVEQLAVQKQMANTLVEIRDLIKSKPEEKASQPQSAPNIDALANRMRSVPVETPVSMSVKR